VRWKSDRECLWLNDCPSQALQHPLKDLDRAFCNFASGRTSAPRFKKRGRHDNFRLPQGCKLEAHHARVFLPRIGSARIRLTRMVEGAIGAVSVCIQTLRTIEPRGVGIGTVGIDLGVTRFATLFDDIKEVVIKSPAPDAGLVSGLRRAERRLSRRSRFGKNWHKARADVQRIQARITKTSGARADRGRDEAPSDRGARGHERGLRPPSAQEDGGSGS
jgi:putative transposase